MRKRAGKGPTGLSELRQFDVVRLLEAARNMLSGVGINEAQGPVVSGALTVVDSMLSAHQQPSTVQPSELADQLRKAARGLIPIADRNVQHAVLAMMIAADMSEVA
jgi:hypothetical protein